jgi:alkylated DNA repair dioxygenase AlkB
MGGTAVATSVTLDLEGSLDDSNWFTLASHVFTAGEITAEQAMFHVADKPVTFARLNLSTLGGGTDPTVTAWYEPGDFVTP